MATTLSNAEIRDLLDGDAARIRGNEFGILRKISALLAGTNSNKAGHELLLRALEHRNQFGACMPALDSLSRSAGLFPYVDPENLSFRDLIAYEVHRPANMDDETLVFHREQAEVYQKLLAGENIILSAPTSFGKSKIVDAMIASGRFDNVAVVVPTLALIDETRRRLAQFRERYKLVSHLGQQPGERNIFVLTPERVVAFKKLPTIDFFAIDEFYKLDAGKENDTRAVALNLAFYRLLKGGGQFYLLGPNIRQIPPGLEKAFRCHFYPTSFSTVVVEQHRVPESGDRLESLVRLCKTFDESTLIFASSPSSVSNIANAFLDAGLTEHQPDLDGAAAWAGENYHPEWIFPRALAYGIGLHHGRLPRSLGQFVVRAFNEGRIRFLICTSTLIEGVNTKAKNVVVYDHSIAQKPIDFFTFNNIKGRSGRMGHHFVGRVFVFDDPPQENLPFVDFPLFTQNESAPESLLIQFDEADLTSESQERLEQYQDDMDLPLSVLRESDGVDPKQQLALAKEISEVATKESSKLAWSGTPKYQQLEYAAELIWEYLVDAKRKHGVFSGKQLTVKTWQLSLAHSVAQRILDELKPGKWAAKSVDDAVDRVLQFDRNWAGFELPRLLMCLHRIQKHVLGKKGLPHGDYSLFAARIECLFATPVVSDLDEYGLPFELALELRAHLKTTNDLDVALANLKSIVPTDRRLKLSPFEWELIRYAQEGI